MLPKARKKNLVIQQSGDDVLVYDLETNQAICLNHTSALIWENCNGEKDIEEIRESLQRVLQCAIPEGLVSFGLRQINEKALLSNESLEFADDKTLSRRDIISKIGLASAVAIPIVASIVAPTAIHAQSCAPVGNGMNLAAPGCPCQNGMDCSSGGGTCQDMTGTPQGMGGIPPITCEGL